jgi:hypothetical protein
VYIQFLQSPQATDIGQWEDDDESDQQTVSTERECEGSCSYNLTCVFALISKWASVRFHGSSHHCHWQTVAKHTTRSYVAHWAESHGGRRPTIEETFANRHPLLVSRFSCLELWTNHLFMSMPLHHYHCKISRFLSLPCTLNILLEYSETFHFMYHTYLARHNPCHLYIQPFNVTSSYHLAYVHLPPVPPNLPVFRKV